MDLIDFHGKDFQQWIEESLEAIIKEKVRGVSIACYQRLFYDQGNGRNA